MSSATIFTSSETRTLQFTPLWVFFAVAAADGKVDKVEVDVFVNELSEADLFKEPLAREVLQSVRGDFGNIWKAFQADVRNVVTGLTQVADLLDRKVSPQIAYNFKAAMLMIGFNVSEATTKGLFGGMYKKRAGQEAPGFRCGGAGDALLDGSSQAGVGNHSFCSQAGRPGDAK